MAVEMPPPSNSPSKISIDLGFHEHLRWISDCSQRFVVCRLQTPPLLFSFPITERDEGALIYLKDIKWCKIEEPKGFKLDFFFDQNPYFKNNLLTKAYHIIDEDEPLLEKAIGIENDWYPGKCLTQKILKKKPKKGKKNANPITKTEDCESFFNDEDKVRYHLVLTHAVL